MQTKSGKLELDKEYPSPDEVSAIQTIEQMIVQKIEHNYQAGERPSRRDAHAKHHGCVKAEFIVENNLSEEMKFGILKEPGKKFTACIRFSNGSGKPQADSKGDGRGMAIKLLGVSGEKLLTDEKNTQDFVMINHPVFFIRNLQDYIDFFKSQEAEGKGPLKFFFPGLNPLKWRLQEFAIATSIQRKKIVSPLAIQYWSMTPYKLGNRAIKFSAKPSVDRISGGTVSSSDNYLKEAMVEHLKSKEACFDFLVQFQTDADKMPIENSTVEWKAPFLKVATIKIPPQSFDSSEQMEFCENLSYTPWHSLPEHQPLGAINRCRKPIYNSISQARHQLNAVSRQEPTESELSVLFGDLN
ncbi:catalase family protein [Plectonema radiosum NIES-515]|uniref:Catalase family protein n=1 Tax=Plectonema radiosum NIES-515 TaxID=2986073 RepID=A0ABT3B5G3_9CYAN|nr:catalase family protein [Plectonema radiosum]MCV3216622.1 catalase family protein [Plectonema radiosum NIES-515]